MISWSVAKLSICCLQSEIANKHWGDVYLRIRKKHFENVRLKYLTRYNIHESVKWGPHTKIYGGGKLLIGRATYFGSNCFILVQHNDEIRIGKHCAVSHNVHIRTSVHSRQYHYRDERYGEPEGKDIVIGSYVWIGANVFIGGGITIGDNVIIGANSVVTKNISSNTIWGGVPAEKIRDKKDYLE